MVGLGTEEEKKRIVAIHSMGDSHPDYKKTCKMASSASVVPGKFKLDLT